VKCSNVPDPCLDVRAANMKMAHRNKVTYEWGGVLRNIHFNNFDIYMYVLRENMHSLKLSELPPNNVNTVHFIR
jgi:hypothetical protein